MTDEANAPQWTGETPTETGFYWHRHIGYKPTVVFVSGNLVRFNSIIGERQLDDKSITYLCEWAGPLVPPDNAVK